VTQEFFALSWNDLHICVVDAEVCFLPCHAKVAANNVRLLKSIKRSPLQQTCAPRLLRFQLKAEPCGRTLVRRVQQIVRNETRMQRVGDAQTYLQHGVLPSIEDAAGVHNATAMLKRSVAFRYRMSKAKHSDFARKELRAHCRPHTCEAVRKKHWHHPASRHLAISLPSSAWAFTQL